MQSYSSNTAKYSCAIRRIGRAVLYISLSIACSTWSQDSPSGGTVSYEDDVHIILAENCLKCHGDEKRKGGLYLGSRESLLEGSENGAVVAVGDSAKSRLIELVAGLDIKLIMPPEDEAEPLGDEEVAILRAWIDQGLVWDVSNPADTQWKSSLAPRRPEIPDIEGISGSSHPIDRFIAAYFERHELAAPVVVADAVFARRCYQDTTGLLPTIEQLDVFLMQDGEDKRAVLVERLLRADRDYAEHWMTFWNDALRNDFQGTGYIDGGRKQITQWLYDSLYYNKPYDQFVRELLHPTKGSRGFTDGIVWRGVTAAAQRPPIQAARSVAQVFLGVNLKCASCHDSFIDDWKLEDSYGLASFFSDEPLELVRCDINTGRMAETKFLWPELGAVDASLSRGARMRRLAELVVCEENGRFSRTAVNRIWARLMGRGLVEPLDTMSNEPWDVDLLDWLATEFVAMEYDVRALLRLIMTSNTYQLASVSSDPRMDDFVFHGPEARRLTAEQYLDALSRLTNLWQKKPKFNPPDSHPSESEAGVRAWRVTSDALTRALGRPNREQVVTRREMQYTTLQALELTNGATLAEYISEAARKLDETLPENAKDRVDVVFRRSLQRAPTNIERVVAEEYFSTGGGKEAIEDFLWSMAMLPEFQLVY